MRHRDHDISLLMPLLNVLERFRDLLQGIASVDDRLELPSRGKSYDEIQSLQCTQRFFDRRTTFADRLRVGFDAPLFTVFCQASVIASPSVSS